MNPSQHLYKTDKKELSKLSVKFAKVIRRVATDHRDGLGSLSARRMEELLQHRLQLIVTNLDTQLKTKYKI